MLSDCHPTRVARVPEGGFRIFERKDPKGSESTGGETGFTLLA